MAKGPPRKLTGMSSVPLLVRVSRKTQEALDICSFELVRPDGAALPPFAAGAHIDVETPGGLIRQYSLCNDSSESNRYFIGVLKDAASRGGSIAMHESLKENDVLRISEPRNHFALAQNTKRSLLLAGGIGITPILCMAERLYSTGSPFELHYCSRSPERMAFYDRILAAPFAIDTHMHFDSGHDSQKLNRRAVLESFETDCHVYVCGPPGFIDIVTKTAYQMGWAEEQVHREYFGATVVNSSGDFAFEVRIASTGKTITIRPNETVLAALSAHGIEIPYSCEQGVCGTCLTRLLGGEPAHRDHFLTEQERRLNDQFLPCCSRSKSKLLILDL
jgi:vanillate monooxygenase ferredoxin subunit